MIRRSKHAQNFTVIPNYIHDHIKDGLAVGILVYLLSKPEDWQARKAYLYKRFTQGRVQIDKAFKILEASGYIHKQRKKHLNNGQFDGWEWVVKDQPTKSKLEKYLGCENRLSEIEQSENRLSENRQLTITDTISTEEQSKENSNLPAPKEAFMWDNLLALINLHTKRKFELINDEVRAKFNKRLKKGYTKKIIRNAIINASISEFHVKTHRQHLTPEFFSRATTLDKYGFDVSGEEPKKEYVATI